MHNMPAPANNTSAPPTAKLPASRIPESGDVVDVTEEGLSVNGYQQREADIYTETLPYKDGIDYPLTVGDGQVFVLGDNRISAEDGRIYGTTDLKDVQGVVMTVIRRRNI